jgi:hypothetical protein
MQAFLNVSDPLCFCDVVVERHQVSLGVDQAGIRQRGRQQRGQVHLIRMVYLHGTDAKGDGGN